MSSVKSLILLVDGDNVAAHHWDQIRKTCDAFGKVVLQRVYYAAGKGNGCWTDVSGPELVHVDGGKNAVDFRMSFDAVEIATQHTTDIFAIVSNDADLRHAALWLRNHQKEVVLIGTSGMSANLAAGFEHVYQLDSTVNAAVPREAAKISPRSCSEIVDVSDIVRQMIRENGGEMMLVDLGFKMVNTHNIEVKQIGNRNWRKYFEARPDAFEVSNNGSQSVVTLLEPEPAGLNM